MPAIITPVNQVRLTNIAIVRYKKHGHRFEIACYKNKVVDWRAGIETDINEVLQTVIVFNNVSKGILAKTSDLVECFSISDPDFCCRMILAHGHLQVSEKERKLALNNKFRDIAMYVCSKCINSETKRPFPVSMVEGAMKELHFKVNVNQGAKQQALELIRQLRESKVLPIQRAAMQLRIKIPLKHAKKLKTQLLPMTTSVSSEDWLVDSLQLIVAIDPGMFRSIDELLKEQTKGEAKLDILDMQRSLAHETDISDFMNDQEYDYKTERII